MTRVLYALLAASLVGVPACDKNKPAVDPAEREAKMLREVEDALTRLRNHELQGADDILTRLYKEMPDNPDIVGGLGKLRFAQSRFDEAEKFLKIAIKTTGDLPGLHYTLGEVYKNTDRQAAAAAAFGQAFALDKENGDYGLAQGEALIKAGQFAKAEPVLRAVAKLNPEVHTPENVGVYTVLGDALRGQDRLDDALHTYMKAQTTYDSDKMARAGAAFVYEAKGDIKHALDEWSAYIQRDCCSDYSRDVAQKKMMQLKVPG